MASVDEIVAFMRQSAGMEIAPWQLEFLERAMSGEPLQVLQRGRGGGRSYLDELLKDVYRRLGYELVEVRGCWTAHLPASAT